MRLTLRRMLMGLIALNVGAILLVLHSLGSGTIDQAAVLPTVPRVFEPATSTTSTTSTTTKGPAVVGSNATTPLPGPAPSACPKLKAPPPGLVDLQVFYSIDNSGSAYVLSAFYDEEPRPLVRLVVLWPHLKTNVVHCQLWYRTPKVSHRVVAATYKRIPEDHGRHYGAAYLKCPLSGGIMPYAVSVVMNPCDKPSHALPVLRNTVVKSNFTVCVTPLNFRYSRAYELMEMLELNLLLGADRLVFYNYSIGPSVDRVLRHYSGKGKVEVVQWHLPMRVDTWPPSGKPEVHYFGQLAALNDCLYRNLGRARFLVFSDLDEFLVPRRTRTWHELLDSGQQKNTLTAAIFFRCTFFRKEWPRWDKDFPGKKRALRHNTTTILTVYREKNVLKPFLRSKFMIRPEGVETVGIHNVWHYKGRRSHIVLDPTEGLLHHYRSWESPGDFHKHELDTYMHIAYRDALLDRLDRAWEELSRTPPDQL